MIVFSIVCVVLALLLAAPVTLRFRYDGKLRMRIWYLCFFYTVPLKQSPEGQKEKRKKPEKRDSNVKKKDPFRALVDKQGLIGAVSDLCGTLRLILERALRLFSHVRVPRLRLCVSTGGKDAAQAAILCGGVCAAVYPLLGFASSVVHMRRPQIDIQPDYTSSDWSARADVKARIALFWCLAAGVSALWALIQSKQKQFKKIETRPAKPGAKSKKGGVSK